MLDLREAAQFARERIRARLVVAEGQKKGLPQSVAIVQRGTSFRAHLIESLRRGGDERQSPSPAPECLFLAFPEKLFAKWCYLAYGPERSSSRDAGQQRVKAPDIWRTWDKLGEDARVTNFARTDSRAILLAHGLSAIDDSVLLLADIGRAMRAARALAAPLHILLADISWISYNRSLRRFDLDEQTIENGLRLCQDRRQRLYEGINAEVKLHAIVPYAKKGAISSQKIQLIAARYIELAGTLWGSEVTATTIPLSNGEVAVIGRPLQASIGGESPLHFLTAFPGAVQALEKALAPHLNVVRTIAQRFRHLSLDTFSYYFAQYYAQDEYRGTHVKIAPVSERDFDEPYDELDESFRSWGDGHEPTVGLGTSGRSKRRRLAAVYLPQYRLGDWELLPYTPLSISAVSKGEGAVRNVRERVILLSDNSGQHHPKISSILRNTLLRSGAAHLNRVVADILSFLQGVVIARGRGTVETSCQLAGADLDQILATLDPNLPRYFRIECEDAAATCDLWLSWLDSIERDADLDYTPCHLLVASLAAEDWSDCRVGAAAALLCAANRLAGDLSD